MSYNYGRYDKYETQAEKDERLMEMRRRASANLTKIARGDYKREADAKRALKTRKRIPSADEIESGHMVLELRELMKLERRISKAADRDFKNSEYNHGMWEEVDHRIETLQEALKAHSRAELTRFVRAYNKSLKGLTND